jgi:hypothetical protein
MLKRLFLILFALLLINSLSWATGLGEPKYKVSGSVDTKSMRPQGSGVSFKLNTKVKNITQQPLTLYADGLYSRNWKSDNFLVEPDLSCLSNAPGTKVLLKPGEEYNEPISMSGWKLPIPIPFKIGFMPDPGAPGQPNSNAVVEAWSDTITLK